MPPPMAIDDPIAHAPVVADGLSPFERAIAAGSFARPGSSTDPPVPIGAMQTSCTIDAAFPAGTDMHQEINPVFLAAMSAKDRR